MDGTYKLKRVKVWKTTITSLILGTFLGLLCGMFAAFMGSEFISFLGAMFDISPSALESLPKMMWIATTFGGAILGLMIGFFGTIILNLTLAMLGGIDLVVNDESHAALSFPVTPQIPVPAPMPVVQNQMQLQPVVQQPIQPAPVQAVQQAINQPQIK